MNLLINLRKNLKIVTFVLAVVMIFSAFSFPIYATSDQDRLDQVQKELAEIRKRQQDLNETISSEEALSSKYGSEIVSLNNEIRKLQLQVQEKQLVIDELNLKVSILEEQIVQTENEIIETQAVIDDLQSETDVRLQDMYLDIKSFDNSISMVFTSESGSDFIKDELYREAIQEETNEKLDKLALEKENLEKDKEQLKQDKIQVESDKTLLEEEQKALELNQTDLDQKKYKYESMKRQSDTAAAALELEYDALSDEEKKLLGEQELLMQNIFNQVGKVPSGTYVKAEKIIGQQGCTGLCTGPHLHFGVQYNRQYQNPCSVIKPLSAANGVACGTNSSKMPNLPMSGTYYFTSGYGYRPSFGKFHYGIDLANTVSNASIIAAHDGWLYRGFEPCNPSYSLCKGGGANWAVICEDKSCNTGYKTMYWHLR